MDTNKLETKLMALVVSCRTVESEEDIASQIMQCADDIIKNQPMPEPLLIGPVAGVNPPYTISITNDAPGPISGSMVAMDNVYLFKLADYTTILLGRYDDSKDCFYIQRGDGLKYEYDSNRVNWKQKLNFFMIDSGPNGAIPVGSY